MCTSKGGQKREKQKHKMRRPATRDGWIRRWKRSIIVIRDRATTLRTDREMYRRYVNAISNNPRLDNSNEFFLLLQRMYIAHMLVALRTFDDTDLRSYSLHNLIKEILDNSTVITREWFVRRYRKSLAWAGDRDFSEHWGKGVYLSRQRLRADLRAVRTACRKVRTVVNKWIAHNARRRRAVQLTWGEVDNALDTVYEVMARYHLLIMRAQWGGFDLRADWMEVFDVPWNTEAMHAKS